MPPVASPGVSNTAWVRRARRLLGAWIFAACACTSRIIIDYNFEAFGTVVDPSGAPITGVRVSVEVSANLYDVITPFRQAVETTREDGSFRFFFLTHAPNPPYTLLFEKSGYKQLVIEGAVREMNPHHVVLEPESSPVISRPPHT